MEKITLEYFRQNDCNSGYAYVIKPKKLHKESILDFLTEWSKNKNVKIFDYSLRKAEESNEKNKFDYCGENPRLKKQEIEELLKDKPPGYHPIGMSACYKIPIVDWVYYLDIYYQ